MKNSPVDLNKLYKLPRSLKEGPNGWIEPTTICQLKCPGCYRGVDTGNVLPKNFPLEILKKQIDDFVTKKNIQTVSIAGGEPLLYPEILELIKYIKSKNLLSKIFTNGIALNKEFLTELREAGATELMIHMDMFQNIPGWEGKNEKELNELRQKYVDLFKEVGGIGLGFIMPISPDNVVYLKDLLDFVKSNIETINVITFTIYKDLVTYKNENNTFDANKLIEALQEIINYEPCAYLPKAKDPNKIAWIVQNGIGNNDEYFGNTNASFYKELTRKYYKKRGKQLFIFKRNKIKSVLNILPMILYKNGFKILKNILFAKNKKLFHQTILIIDMPNYLGDWCEGCPNIMYYGDKLFASCALNNLNEFKTDCIKE